jgi:hypothetical protein
MAKRVFFSFHYQDVTDFRANVVRNHWLTKPDREDAGFFDASLWENTKRTGDVAIKNLINTNLLNTSATCVLIGSETYARHWVRYEILKSFLKGNSLLAVHINGIKGRDQLSKPQGPNPLRYLGITYSHDGQTLTLWQIVNGEWSKYTEIDGSADFPTNVSAEYRGKGFNLAPWYREYDWVANDGFNNFATWVG